MANAVVVVLHNVTIPLSTVCTFADLRFDTKSHSSSINQHQAKLTRTEHTIKTNRFANRTIAYFLNRENKKLPKKRLFHL